MIRIKEGIIVKNNLFAIARLWKYGNKCPC